MSDPINSPSHYTQYEHEVIELTSQMDFCMGNVAKYILRAEHKGKKVEDLKKALWYLNYYVEEVCPEADEYSNRMDGDAEFCELVHSYTSPLLVAVLDDPAGAGMAELMMEIKDAEIEDLKFQLAEEKARKIDELNSADWSEINKLFRQADDMFRDTLGNYKVWSMSR